MQPAMHDSAEKRLNRDGTTHASSTDMIGDHIDFISAYCDRWCERCPLTHRCSAFTAQAAVAMCGNDSDGLELAFGRAPNDDGVVAPLPHGLEELDGMEMSKREEAEWRRTQDERRARVDRTSIMISARAFACVAWPWLRDNAEGLAARDPVVQEAFEIASWDSTQISAKLYRALDGRDCYAAGEETGWDDPVQNDWNGSAKVVLLGIERSQQAWSLLASCTGDRVPATLAAWLQDLRTGVEQEFPDARKFRRPGFDD
jgi:hypothetical protein